MDWQSPALDATAPWGEGGRAGGDAFGVFLFFHRMSSLMQTYSVIRGAALAAALCTALAAPALAGNAATGAKLFEGYCSDCHTVVAGGGNNKGPNLFGVVGRKTASVADFDYSDAHRAANWVWTPEVLDSYLTAPREKVVGTKMKFKGIPDAGERADVIAYLSSLK